MIRHFTQNHGQCPEPSEERHRAIVVGYGSCGEIMTGIRQKYDIEVVALEMNIDTENRLARKGIPALHEDARLLRSQGAETVFPWEEKAALSMASFTLRTMGATEEQVAREHWANRARLAGENVSHVPGGIRSSAPEKGHSIQFAI